MQLPGCSVAPRRPPCRLSNMQVSMMNVDPHQAGEEVKASRCSSFAFLEDSTKGIEGHYDVVFTN